MEFALEHDRHNPSVATFDRRRFLFGTGAAAAVGGIGLAGATTPAAAAIDQVPVDKLMSRGDDLPDLELGKKDAKVTIVEYMSMTCPACRNFHTNVFPKLKEKYIETGKVHFIMREFPLDQLAAAASMLARCLGPERAVPFISVLFKTQPEWRTRNPVPKLMEISKQAGITKEKFEKCLGDEQLLDKLVKHRDKADKDFGVDATPSFFINGKRLKGGYGIEDFEKVLDPLLQG
jgi:protein-disulfide isomerase